MCGKVKTHWGNPHIIKVGKIYWVVGVDKHMYCSSNYWQAHKLLIQAVMRRQEDQNG